MRLILASASPRRRELLTRCGVDFTVKTVDVTELKTAADPAGLPAANALLKARAAAQDEPDAVIIGADTIVLLSDGDSDIIIGKPRDMADAAAILRKLSGRTHRVITGVALCRTGAAPCEEFFSVTTAVTFRELDAERIAAYLARVNVLDKAGAYALQEYGDMIVVAVQGDRDNVVGLPCAELLPRLRRMCGEQQ